MKQLDNISGQERMQVPIKFIEYNSFSIFKSVFQHWTKMKQVLCTQRLVFQVQKIRVRLTILIFHLMTRLYFYVLHPIFFNDIDHLRWQCCDDFWRQIFRLKIKLCYVDVGFF